MASDDISLGSIMAPLVKKAREVANKVVMDASRTAADELSPTIAEDLRVIFYEAVNAWYGSYSPSVYNRKYNLYDMLTVDINGSDGEIGWKVSADGLEFDSWTGKPFNAWYQIYYGGYHGGPIGMWTDDGDYISKWSPPYSAPIPNLFTIGRDELENDYSLRAKAIIEREFYKNFNQAFDEA